MMRRNLVCGSLISIALVGAAAAQTTTTSPTAPGRTGSARSATATTPSTVTSPTAGAVKHGGHGQVREALHWAHKLLAEADHDYDGHRARAAHEVHLALEELGAHHSHPAVASSGTTATQATAAARHVTGSATPAAHVTPAATATAAHVGAGTLGGHESQAKSDAQLRRAREILRMASAEISARHPRAHVHVREAIGEIDRALSLK